MEKDTELQNTIPIEVEQAVSRQGFLEYPGQQNKPDEVTRGQGARSEAKSNNTLNDLNGTEWLAETSTIWFQKGLGVKHPHAQIERQHPAPFSFQDVARLIRFFTKNDALVLDPFVGVGSTLKACEVTGRRGVGIELIPRWAELSRQRLQKEVGLFALQRQQIIQGDARVILREPRFADGTFDFIVTSPPYWCILNKHPDHKTKAERIANGLATQYSDDDADLGNILSYEEFLKQLGVVFSECRRVLKPGKYMCIFVSDFRHGSEYVPYHSDVINVVTHLKETDNFELQGITILVQNRKKVYPYGYPTTYVPNVHHQYILIFRNARVHAKMRK